ncbi:hypothetical protein M9Y10_002512 [Tritrichomonas musculus]|uniref:Serine/threonine-protein phosphatase n=1 Tax=Tritrichomonas musculus TaxID=1915356 RepID=A0ABR2LA14_9EUKA
MLSSSEIDEIVFQVLLSRMHGKKRYAQPVTSETMHRLLNQVQDLLKKEPVMLELSADIAVVGDIHGNIDDLLRIFERLRYPPAMRYIFLGDYVDRGIYGTEVLMLLFALKIKYPDNVYLLRGNHETENLSRFYGFYKEISGKYEEDIYMSIIDTFELLPLCAIIGERIFCVHGGISPQLKNVDDLIRYSKPKELSGCGIFTDMTWSDPGIEVDEFATNERGCGYIYGPRALTSFLDDNGLDLLVRSHEMCIDGVAWPYADDEETVDRCLTVFSNSNYCYRGNSGAILHISSDLLVNVEVFPPLSEQEIKKRKVLLPYWLFDMIAKKEAEKKSGAGGRSNRKEMASLRQSENEKKFSNSVNPMRVVQASC